MKRRGCCLSVCAPAMGSERTQTTILQRFQSSKFCGLPLKEIRSFLPLIQPGGETLGARRDILAKERDNVRAQIAALQTKLERLEFGCWFYETAQQYGSVLPLYEFSEEHFPPEHRNVLRESFHLPLTHVRTKLEW